MISISHKNYLKKIKKYNFYICLTQLLIFVFLIFIWQLLADLNIINTFIASSPKNVVNTIVDLIDKNNLFKHIFITVYETIISFFLGTIIGIVIASILWWNNFIRKVIDPYLTVLNSLPKVALGPIIIVWCGANQKSIILMALLISTIIMIINVSDSFLNVDDSKIKLMKSFKANKFQIFFKLVFPCSFSSIISALKICISMSLIGVIMGEFLVSKSGIGYLIMYGSQVFNLNLVITGVIMLAILSWIMYSIILWIEKKLIKN